MQFLKFILILVVLSLPVLSYSQKTLDEKNEDKTQLIASEEAKASVRLKRMLAAIGEDNMIILEKYTYNFILMGQEVVPHLLNLLRDKDQTRKVHINVIYLLGRLGADAKEAVPTITAFLRDKDSDFKAVALRALGKIGKYSEDAIGDIAKLLNNRDKWVRKSAYDSLIRINTYRSKKAIRDHEKSKKEQQSGSN